MTYLMLDLFELYNDIFVGKLRDGKKLQNTFIEATNRDIMMSILIAFTMSDFKEVHRFFSWTVVIQMASPNGMYNAFHKKNMILETKLVS